MRSREDGVREQESNRGIRPRGLERDDPHSSVDVLVHSLAAP